VTSSEVEGAINRAFAAVSESFITAAGPGGQNVNKVATAVQLRVSIYALRLPPLVFARMKELAGSRLTDAGRSFWSRAGSARRNPIVPTRGKGWQS
jgi:ribosome-associated protein